MWRNLIILRRNVGINSIKSQFINSQGINISKLSLITANYHVLSRFQNITCSLQSEIVIKKLQHTKQHELDIASSEQNSNSFTYRTHTCGDLRAKNKGEKVIICGWVQWVRFSKFLLLRDAYGLTQCIVGETNIDLNFPLDTVLKVEGIVRSRPENMINQKMETGEIEVVMDKVEVLNTAEDLPFNVRDYQKAKEQLRLQHRYVDLRFPEMQTILRHRSSMLHNMRRFLVEKHNFVEVETPTLFCRTPGGAREFVVPTHHAGLFYSLVQSPQQFKQMLMAGGVDRYFQIARCYRDESTRPDRQPEFTQLDIELSFTNLDGILSLIEQLLYETYPRTTHKPPFKRMTYKYALENYGTDKPNLSFDFELKNIKHMFPKKKDHPNFHAYVLPFPKQIGKTNAFIEAKIVELAVKYVTKIILPESIPKKLGTFFLEKLEDVIGRENNGIIALGNTYEDACLTLGELREMVATILKTKRMLTLRENVEPLWIVDFPLFVKGKSGLETCHHPFTAPHPEDVHLLDTEPLKVRSLAYDLVLNGNEVGGGSVRVHDVELQKKLLKMLNIDATSMSHFLNALKSGCPPHAGIALGIDRLVGIACNAESIRDVIAFPKSHDGRDPLSGAPNRISDDDKKYYHIATVENK
ncbi:hypothetical protein O0L34_g16440 [Tuta absoluta]|nr:hypothetical protein O0L34_g16440 [Tuta absoluta]